EPCEGCSAELECRSQTGRPLIERLRKFLSSATVRITLARPRRLWTRLNSFVSPVSSVVSARVMRAVSRDGFKPGTEAAGPINPGQSLGLASRKGLARVGRLNLSALIYRIGSVSFGAHFRP